MDALQQQLTTLCQDPAVSIVLWLQLWEVVELHTLGWPLPSWSAAGGGTWPPRGAAPEDGGPRDVASTSLGDHSAAEEL